MTYKIVYSKPRGDGEPLVSTREDKESAMALAESLRAVGYIADVWEYTGDTAKKVRCDNLADLMLAYRARTGMTQAELAEAVGTTRVTINRAETGKPIARLTEAKIRMQIESGE